MFTELEFYLPANLFIYSVKFDVSRRELCVVSSLDNTATVLWMLIWAGRGREGGRRETEFEMSGVEYWWWWRYSSSPVHSCWAGPVQVEGSKVWLDRPSWEYSTQYSPQSHTVTGVVSPTQTIVSGVCKLFPFLFTAPERHLVARLQFALVLLLL